MTRRIIQNVVSDADQSSCKVNERNFRGHRKIRVSLARRTKTNPFPRCRSCHMLDRIEIGDRASLRRDPE
jgi:hypothetical protein